MDEISWVSEEGINKVDEPVRASQWEIKDRINGAWNALMEVLKRDPENAIKEFITYSKSANIRRFSPLNRFFLYAQSDGKARFVLTKKAWERLGRKVKDGEKPLRVFVVLPVQPKHALNVFRGRSKSRRARFNEGKQYYTYMEHEEYDISQTEGEIIPEPRSVEEAPCAETLLRSLKEYCCRHGIELTDEPIISGAGSPEEINDRLLALGSTDGSRIYVRDDLSVAQQARVLSHEVAHTLMHKDFFFAEPGDGRPPIDRADWEVEAEAVACLVCAAWSIDTTEESKYYLMLFKKHDIPLEHVSERILMTVREVLGSLYEPVPIEAMPQQF